ncbi:unnamed protein product [Periconia digitata]|uniref:C2H2-type domain-containing protein n=1 Tax=Periconia digitata TaxID=1303443 RepID=A0A9W4XX88_9PLEO|nr:unnamed protein product [Periconia digitata]
MRARTQTDRHKPPRLLQHPSPTPYLSVYVVDQRNNAAVQPSNNQHQHALLALVLKKVKQLAQFVEQTVQSTLVEGRPGASLPSARLLEPFGCTRPRTTASAVQSAREVGLKLSHPACTCIHRPHRRPGVPVIGEPCRPPLARDPALHLAASSIRAHWDLQTGCILSLTPSLTLSPSYTHTLSLPPQPSSLAQAQPVDIYRRPSLRSTSYLANQPHPPTYLPTSIHPHPYIIAYIHTYIHLLVIHLSHPSVRTQIGTNPPRPLSTSVYTISSSPASSPESASPKPSFRCLLPRAKHDHLASQFSICYIYLPPHPPQSAMSDPSDLSGPPLASTIHQQHHQQQQHQHQPSQANQASPPSASRRRRRRQDSQSSDERVDSAKPISSRRRLGSRKEPRRDSSIVDSPTMQRSASPSHPSPDSVHYTRTGRISKAKKGLKVHNCECGRSYTRAEHLRRHQKNHAQDTLLCEYPGCGKPFFRIDLLQRHQERHNETENGSPQPSAFSPGSTGEAEVTVSAPPPVATPTVASTPHPPYYPQSASPMPEPAPDASGNTKHRSPFSTRQAPAVPVPMDGLQTAGIPWSDSFSQSPSYSPSSGYASPIPHSGDYANMFANPPYGPGAIRTRASSNASYNEPNWSYPSRSPTSATSTMAYAWNSNDKSPAPPHMAYMTTSYPMTSVPMTSGVESMPYGHYGGPKTLAQRDQDEQAILFPEQSYGMGQIAHTYPYEQYLNNYWRHFHPTFPVIHRATFDSIASAPTPMLQAAAIAIGGQYSSDPSVKRKSRILHDRCMKLLNLRDFSVMTEGDRTCDWQALFLVEVLSQYRARRAAKSLSLRFEMVYRQLCQNFRTVTSSLVDISSALVQPENATADLWAQWVELSTQQRLLLGCYILECHQVTLLARDTPQPLTQLSGLDLPFPSHSSLWDATSITSWAMEAQQYSHLPPYVYQVTSDLVTNAFDVFQSSLLITAHHNHFPPSQCVVEHLLSDSAATKHQLLTSKLVHVTPIRALLGVSGESWILSEKVSSPQVFNDLKAALRSWVNGLWADPSGSQEEPLVKDALKLAIEILQHALAAPNDTLRLELGADMGLYYAVLVIWVVTVATTTHPDAPQPPLQYPLHPALSAPHGFSTQDHLVVDSPEITPNPAHPGTLFSLPEQLTSQVQSSPPSDMQHAETTAMMSLSFLDNALVDLNYLGMVPQWPRDPAQWQQGCSVLTRWAKMRLRNASTEAQDSVVSSCSNPGPASAAMGCGGDGYGEVLDGVIGVLDKLVEKGWTIWEI